MKRIILSNLVLILISAFIIAVIPAKLQAQEHPKEEHPKGEASLTPEALAEEIEQYVKNESEAKSGYFEFYDEETETPLKLTLDNVHKDKLSKVDERLYFACSDFKSTDGKIYDLDFFIKETDSGLEVTQQTLHKVDGKARYTWFEEEGVWKQNEK